MLLAGGLWEVVVLPKSLAVEPLLVALVVVRIEMKPCERNLKRYLKKFLSVQILPLASLRAKIVLDTAWQTCYSFHRACA